MSYIAPSVGISKRLQIAEITISGSPSTNGYFTFSSLVDHTFDTAPTGLNSTTLSLPSGNYMIRCILDVTKSSSNHNYTFKIEAGGNLIGRKGQTGVASNLKSDVAEAPHESGSNFNLRLKCTAIESSAPTLTSGSKCFIWRCAQ